MTDFGAIQDIKPQLNSNQLDAFSTAISTECSTWNICPIRKKVFPRKKRLVFGELISDDGCCTGRALVTPVECSTWNTVSVFSELWRPSNARVHCVPTVVRILCSTWNICDLSGDSLPQRLSEWQAEGATEVSALCDSQEMRDKTFSRDS